MNDKTHISLKTKKILMGTGIVFGTVLVFVVSFFLSFSLIINPISFSPIGSDDVAAENEELKTQVQTLEDEVEYLNAAVEKYKNNVNTPAPPQTVDIPVTTTPSAPQQKPATPTGDGANSPSDSNPSPDDIGGESSVDEEFTPDTVTTPEGGFEPEIEPDVTVIDVSE